MAAKKAATAPAKPRRAQVRSNVRSFVVGSYEVTVKGPKEGLRFESRHDFLQFATGDALLRENGGMQAFQGLTDLGRATMADGSRAGTRATYAPSGDSIPSQTDGTTHVLHEIGLKALPHDIDLPPGAAEEVVSHLASVTDSVGGY